MKKNYLVSILALLIFVSCGQAIEKDEPLPEPNPAPAPIQSSNRIVYKSVAGISIMDTDGKNIIQLTSTDDTSPQFSPDGSKIAFLSRRDGSLELYLMDTDGSNQEKLTSCGDIDSFSFSHNGTKIGLTNCKNQGFGLYILDIEKKEIEKIADHLFIPGINLNIGYLSGYKLNKGLTFTPDDSALVFAVRNIIYKYDLSTKKLQQIFSKGAVDVYGNGDSLSYPVFSPDSKRIAFVYGFKVPIYASCFKTTIDFESFEVMSINSDGSGEREEFYEGFYNYVSNVSWSSDSSEIIFQQQMIEVCGSSLDPKIYKVEIGTYGKNKIDLGKGEQPNCGKYISSGEPIPTPEPPDQEIKCGDGIINGTDECDDGNTRNGDGCSDICKKQSIPASPVTWSVNLHPEDVYGYKTISKPSIEQSLSLIKELGAKMVRIDIPWDDIEPTEENFDDQKILFLKQIISAAVDKDLEPIVVLARIPQWALTYYNNRGNGQKYADYYWSLWEYYCSTVAYEFGDLVEYYQMANEANAAIDPIAPEDDATQFIKCRAGIKDYDTDQQFQTIVNLYSNSISFPWNGWVSIIEDWLEKAGNSIDIIGIDHYPATWSFTEADDQYPLDELFRLMDEYGKKGAIVETGFSSYSDQYNHSEKDQKNWVNIALPTIKEKISSRIAAGKSNLEFANFYELRDSGEYEWWREQEGYFGLIKKDLDANEDPQKKMAFDALRDQIIGTKVASLSVRSAGDNQVEHPADRDNDGVPDTEDNCVNISNPGQEITKDIIHGDACYKKVVLSSVLDHDGDGVRDIYDTDDDNDGYTDDIEKSLGADPLNKNSKPQDNDGDFIPDRLDSDDDNDGVLDNKDAFPFDPSESLDTDKDGIGNNADNDDDNDGFSDVDEIAAGTNPLNPYSKPLDFDKDGIPDVSDPDDDNDGVADELDAFPKDSKEWADNDKDGIGDNKDKDDDNDLYTDEIEKQLGTDPLDAASKPPDCDYDLIPDQLDPDDDNDGVPDEQDVFICDAGESADYDKDGIGNNKDTDDDNDCYSDQIEITLGTETQNDKSTPPDLDKDCSPDAMDPDKDGDGFISDPKIDACDMDPESWGPNTDSTGSCDDGGKNADLDDDNDCYTDTTEVQLGSDPLNPLSTPEDFDKDCLPDAMDPDDDNDSYLDENDTFPHDPTEWLDTDKDGLGNNADMDDDNDGYSDDVEKNAGSDPLNPNSKPADCDNDFIPNLTDPDDDNDGHPDNEDEFPCNPNEWVDTDKDGLGNNIDADDDNDCYADAIELQLGSDPLNSSSKPADNDNDCNPNLYDPDDDNDGVLDVDDAFPFDPTEWHDNDGDTIGDNKDTDDDNDTMPDIWENLYGLNSLVNDALGDLDNDGFPNDDEYDGGGIPNNPSSIPPFAGTSTSAPCSSQSECVVGGCIDTTCKGISESDGVCATIVHTPRTYEEPDRYGLSCGCGYGSTCYWDARVNICDSCKYLCLCKCAGTTPDGKGCYVTDSCNSSCKSECSQTVPGGCAW